MAMQLGAFFPTRDMPADHGAIREWAQAAESIGFDFVEVPDHVLAADRNALPDFEGPYDITDSFHETLVTLAFIAGVTTRIGLASGVLILPQRQTALVAKQTAQLDIVSNGRLRLGVGVGWNTEEYKALGQEWTTRGRRQAEQVELLQHMWTQRTVDFKGDFDSVHHLGLNPLPVQRPIPLWFGGSAEPVLRRAARFGQGWIPLGDPDELVKERLARLHTYLTENGRVPSGVLYIRPRRWQRRPADCSDATVLRSDAGAGAGLTTRHIRIYHLPPPPGVEWSGVEWLGSLCGGGLRDGEVALGAAVILRTGNEKPHQNEIFDSSAVSIAGARVTCRL
jgi:probable F420-dependent oxidoreductase